MTPDWTQDCFRKYLEDTNPLLWHGDSLLWRCFSFYAFHPFSSSMSSEKIDWEAFQRAVFLLGMRGVDRLGVMNDDILWTKDFRRMFRSISIWEARNQESRDHKHAYKESMEETTNGLAMVQPFHELRPPREDRLKKTASRLLGPDTKARYLLLVEDLTRLVRLLLQLRVREGRRRTRFHSSTFYSFELMQDDLADKLTDVNVLIGTSAFHPTTTKASSS